MLARRLAEAPLPGGRGLSQLEGQGRGQLATLEGTLERGLELLEEAEPPAHPVAGAAQRRLDLGEAVALVEEVADRPRLLQGAHASPRRVEDEAPAARLPRVDVVDAGRDARPAEVPHGAEAKDAVDELVAAVFEREHVEGALEPGRANAVS